MEATNVDENGATASPTSSTLDRLPSQSGPESPTSTCMKPKIFLPPDYEYELIDSGGRKCCIAMRANISDESGAEKWLRELQYISKVTWRVKATKQKKNCIRKVNVYQKYFRCQHNTIPRSSTADSRKSSKNTKCPALLNLTVKRTIFPRKSRAKIKDYYLPNYPAIIEFINEHNHKSLSTDSLRVRDVSKTTEDKLRDLFAHGHSPSSALKAIKKELQDSADEDFLLESADRAKCPDLAYCFRLYYKIFQRSVKEKKKIGKQCTQDACSQQKADENTEQQESTTESVEMDTCDKDSLLLPTPLHGT